jgi:hypothetical protein
MSKIKRVFAATMFAMTWPAMVCAVPQAEDLTSIGPLNVERFLGLREHLGVEPTGSMPAYFGDAIYNNVLNILIDSVLQSEGSQFCLPDAVIDLTTAQIFHEMVPLIDRAVSLAPAEHDLRNAIVGYLASMFPCPPK